MISPIEVSPASVPGDIKIIRVTQGARKQVVFRLTHDRGEAVDLHVEVENPPANEPDWSPQSSAVGSNVGIRLRSQQPTWGGELMGAFQLDVEGEILNQAESRGFVSFLLQAEHLNRVGIFELYVERYVKDGGDGQRIDTWPVLLAVEPTAMGLLNIRGRGPLLIPEIRLALLDVDNGTDGAPFSNLLDDTEFTDIDIVFAQRRVVQLWNETPPTVGTYSTQNFPYRYHWLECTVGHLLMMSANRYSRNRLAYQAGGIAIDDQSKAKEYMELGNHKVMEFKEWMRNEKYRLNMESCWATGL